MSKVRGDIEHSIFDFALSSAITAHVFEKSFPVDDAYRIDRRGKQIGIKRNCRHRHITALTSAQPFVNLFLKLRM